MKHQSILFVVTSHSSNGPNERKTGLWLDEYATPFEIFRTAGFHIVTASPLGGCVPIDPASIDGSQSLSDDLADALWSSIPIWNARSAEFCAVFYPGGHGPLWDLSINSENRILLEEFITAGKYVAAVCHGPAALLAANEKEDRPFLYGKKVTGFSNIEEKAIHLEEWVPFLLEDRMRAEGALYSAGKPGEEYVCEDGLLITGQNPASARAVANLLLARLK